MFLEILVSLSRRALRVMGEQWENSERAVREHRRTWESCGRAEESDRRAAGEQKESSGRI